MKFNDLLMKYLKEDDSVKEIPKLIYHFTIADKCKNIELSNELRANEHGLICCTIIPDYMNFNTNNNMTRLTINTEIISKIPNLQIYHKNPDDKDYNESEKEIVIDLNKCIDKFLKVKENDIKIEYSPKLNDNSMMSSMIKKRLAQIEKEFKEKEVNN